MKLFYILTMVACMVAFESRAETSDYQIRRSKPIDDVVLQVAMRRKGDGTISSASPIEYGWFTVTNKGSMMSLPKNEYLCSIQLVDSNKNPMPLKAQFKDVGKLFLDLKYPSPEQPWSAIEDAARIRPAHGTQSAAAEVVFAGQKSCEGRSLPSPDDLFQIEIPGSYQLKLQFQAYERIYKGGQRSVYKLERFNPIEFTVVKAKKPQDSQTK